MKYSSLLPSFLFILHSAFFFTHSASACDLSNVSLVSYVENGGSHDYVIQVCIGGGVLGTNRGADADTETIVIAMYNSGNAVNISNFTSSITSTETNVTMNAIVTGPLTTAPYFADNALGYLHTASAPFLCVSSTAQCGTLHQDCFDISFTTDAFLESLTVFGAEGNGNPSAGCYPNPDMSLDFSVLLPVELSYFRGRQKANAIELEWETSAEQNNDYFILERADESGHFSTIATVDGAGTTNSTQHYTYRDSPEEGSTYYYRLKQVDYDGTEAYRSSVVVVNFRIKKETMFSIYPNPAVDEIFLPANQSGEVPEVVVNIYDYSGKLFYQRTHPSDGSAYIPLTAFPTGLYIIELTHSDGIFIERKRIVKK